ncbi:MAG: hypothetical protein KJZ47_04135, partial [Gemmatimonadales bacterium]|nr:hypothetical protein [Gemmatimonadales bacterium]
MEILIADDTPTVTAGVKHFLEADGHHVLSVEHPAEAEALFLASSWDVLILGFLAGAQQAVCAGHLQRILELDRSVPILVLSPVDDQHLETGVRNLGADGFISISAQAVEFGLAVRALSAGASWFQPPPRPGTLLTPRQLEVIQALSSFESHKVASANLRMSLTTFERHLVEARERLGVGSTLRLLAEAERRRLLTLPPESLRGQPPPGSGAAGQRGSGAAGPKVRSNRPIGNFSPRLDAPTPSLPRLSHPTPARNTPADPAPMAATQDPAATPTAHRRSPAGLHPASRPPPAERRGLRPSTP